MKTQRRGTRLSGSKKWDGVEMNKIESILYCEDGTILLAIMGCKRAARIKLEELNCEKVKEV